MIQLCQEWAEMIKIEHTVFALPFALSGLLLALPGMPSINVVIWTILAFVGARSAAMTLNRLIDAQIDKLNPRTKDRAIASGRISQNQAIWLTLASFALMLWAASHLPVICLYLSPIAIFWLSFYSYTKRFTWTCHFALGVALAGAALGGWIARAGALHGTAPWVFAFAVLFWVAGFDIIYACQDIDFDKQEKLFSLPACFGIKNALFISSLLHVGTVCALIALGLLLKLGFIYWIGMTFVAIMLIYEHKLVSPQDLSRLNAAFFNINGYVSIAAFLAIFIDKMISS